MAVARKRAMKKRILTMSIRDHEHNKEARCRPKITDVTYVVWNDTGNIGSKKIDSHEMKTMSRGRKIRE